MFSLTSIIFLHVSYLQDKYNHSSPLTLKNYFSNQDNVSFCSLEWLLLCQSLEAGWFFLDLTQLN